MFNSFLLYCPLLPHAQPLCLICTNTLLIYLVNHKSKCSFSYKFSFLLRSPLHHPLFPVLIWGCQLLCGHCMPPGWREPMATLNASCSSHPASLGRAFSLPLGLTDGFLYHLHWKCRSPPPWSLLSLVTGNMVGWYFSQMSNKSVLTERPPDLISDETHDKQSRYRSSAEAVSHLRAKNGFPL